jgi:hypothetical protein
MTKDVKWQQGGLIAAHEPGSVITISNELYRHHLQTKASKIVDENQRIACNEVSPVTTWTSAASSSFTTHEPYLYKNPLSDAKPLGYESSDLKQSYLARYRANSAKTRIRVPDDQIHVLKGLFAANDAMV